MRLIFLYTPFAVEEALDDPGDTRVEGFTCAEAVNFGVGCAVAIETKMWISNHDSKSMSSAYLPCKDTRDVDPDTREVEAVASAFPDGAPDLRAEVDTLVRRY